MSVEAVQQIRGMRGKTESQLMLGADRNLYVVKFQNNPQGSRVLANEFLATALARTVGLSVPECEVIEVRDWLIENTPEFGAEFSTSKAQFKAGLQFGSLFVGGPMPLQVWDYLPGQMLRKVGNLIEFAGMLAFDKWSGNRDFRQTVFTKREACYTAWFIDQGDCFNAGAWKSHDLSTGGVHGQNLVYEEVSGWDCFSPWLERIESMSADSVWSIAKTIPGDWYDNQTEELERLVGVLVADGKKVRDRITQFRQSSRDPFPAWVKQTAPSPRPGGRKQDRHLLVAAIVNSTPTSAAAERGSIA